MSEPLRFAGYAALFHHRDGVRDAIAPGAFAETLATRDDPLPLYWQHRADRRIGWVEQAAEDARGLRVVARLDDPHGRAAVLLRARAVTGLSFGYRARRAAHHAGGRDLLALDLAEISLVTHPMQHAARVIFVGSPAF